MIEQWHPADRPAAAVPSAEVLARLANMATQLAAGDSPAGLFREDDLQDTRQALVLPVSAWQPLFATLEESVLRDLMVFFASAEEQLDGWQCADKNPAIAAFSVLKQRDQQPDADFIRHVKSLTRNRYIPRGALL